MTDLQRPDQYRFDQRRLDRLHEQPARARQIDPHRPAADLAMPGRSSTEKRDGRPGSWAPWAVPTWFRGWSVQTSSEQERAAAGRVVLSRAAHRRLDYREVGFAPTRRVSWPAEAVRMRAAWQRAGSVRWAAGHPSEGDFALLQSTIRSAARPLSTQSRTAAVVVSPIHPQCRNPSASLYKAKAEPPCRHLATSQGSLQSSGRHTGGRRADRADCLSASPESCPKTLSDNLLHDLCCDCLPGTVQAGCAGRLRAPCVLARAT